MDIIKLIQKAKSDKALNIIAKLAIKKANRFSKDNNGPTTFIGTGADINFTTRFDGQNYSIYDHFQGYIPKGMKIVYGTFFDFINKTYANLGCYYYLDDESYIVDFFRFLRNQDINDDYDIFIAIGNFLNDYFNNGCDAITRKELHSLFLNIDGSLFPPIKEHSITDFYGNGSALCSEYSALAQNILSVLGYNVIYMLNKTHAYNVVVFESQNEYRALIIDFLVGVRVFDHNFKCTKVYPFIQEIPNLSYEMLDEFINFGRKIILQDYFLQEINGFCFKHFTDQIREYSLMNGQIFDSKFEVNSRM